MTKAEAQELRKLYSSLVARPADETRRLAVEQRDRLAGKLGRAKDAIGNVLQRWKQYDDALEAVRWHIDQGDQLTARTDEQSRVQRRQQYARAFLRGQQAAQDLDAEVSQGGTAVLVLREAADVAGTVIKKTAEKAEQIADSATEGLSTGLLLGGLILGAGVLYVLTKNGRGSSYGI